MAAHVEATNINNNALEARERKMLCYFSRYDVIKISHGFYQSRGI